MSFKNVTAEHKQADDKNKIVYVSTPLYRENVGFDLSQQKLNIRRHKKQQLNKLNFLLFMELKVPKSFLLNLNKQMIFSFQQNLIL